MTNTRIQKKYQASECVYNIRELFHEDKSHKRLFIPNHADYELQE